jgi:hypothetical protein
MTKLLILLAIFCVFGTGASAQVKQDTLITDYPGGISANGTQTLTNKTLTSPDINTQTSLPACASTEEGRIDYVKAANTAGYPVMCINNKGYYENVPMIPSSLGFVWLYSDMLSEGDDYSNDSGGLYIHGTAGETIGADIADANYPGNIWFFTAASTNAILYAVFATGNSPGGFDDAFYNTSHNPTCEWVIETDSAIASMVIEVGFTVDANNATASDMALIRYDTGNSDTTWQAVTKNTTETVTDTGVTVSTGTYYRVLVVKSGSDIKFYIATGTGDYALEATHTTNLPDSDLNCAAIVQALTTTSVGIYLNYARTSVLGISR